MEDEEDVEAIRTVKVGKSHRNSHVLLISIMINLLILRTILKLLTLLTLILIITLRYL